MIYTRDEQIEILEAQILDCEANIRRAFSEEQKAKARIELRRTKEKLEILKELKSSFMKNIEKEKEIHGEEQETEE